MSRRSNVGTKPRYPWERQKGESARAFAAFEHYLDTDKFERTIRRTCRELGLSWSSCSNWSSRWSWTKRAEAWDRYQSQRARRAKQKAIDKMHERQANHALMAQIVAIASLKQFVRSDENPNPPKLNERNAIRLFDVASRIEWRARGEPDTKIEGKVETSASADDTRASMVKLLENPEAVEHMSAISRLLGTDDSKEE